jgi:mono/diheme cytochrome c family protein
VKTALVVAATLSLAFPALAQPVSGPARRASVANGEAIFLRLGCPACHGTVGHGGAGTRLAPGPLPLEAFRAWVRTGSPGWSFARGMPAFPPAVVSDDELADVRVYLASVPAPRAADDIPLLDLAR